VKRALWLPALAFALACTTPLAEGERLYREGDRLGALESWRAIPADSFEHAESQERIAFVEAESDGLATRYKQRARYHEHQELLAESILYYRLALKLQPDDSESLAHVQTLARTLAERKAALGEQYDAALEVADLATASARLDEMRTLDSFDPTLQTERQILNDAIEPAIDERIATGRRLYMAGDLAGAKRSFGSVLELAPDNATAQGYISIISQMQREAEAKSESAHSATFAASKGFAPIDEARAEVEGLVDNARRAVRRRKPYDAIKLYERALAENPDHPEAKHELEILRRQLAPTIDARIEAGRRAYREENLELARDIWDEVLLVDEDNERARAYRDRAKQQLRNLDRLRMEPDVAGGGG